MRKLGGLVLILALAVACSNNPADEVAQVETMSTDGAAVYAVADATDAGSRLIKFDADGSKIWEREIGYSNDGGHVHGDYLWVAENEPLGAEPSTPLSPDRLMKIDLDTGETIGSVVIGSGVDEPTLLIDDQLWLLSAFDIRFDVVDPEALEVVEMLDVRTGDVLERPDVDLLGDVAFPVRVEDHIYFLGSAPTSIVKYSIARREIEAVLETTLRVRWPFEVHDGEVWVLESLSTVIDESEWLAHPLNVERFEFGTPVPFFESPMLSLTTDEFVFDQTGPDEITQIDRQTGDIVRTIEGREPELVLDNHLWLANLDRIDIS